MTTRLASHANRRDVSAETRASVSWRIDWPGWWGSASVERLAGGRERLEE